MGWVTELHPTREELDACVQCGLCLPHCPTFRLTGKETASPRGRLHAMTAVSDGVVDVDGAFAGIIDFCLGCRACEPVCPGMVPFGRALEGARAELAAQQSSMSHRIRAWALGPGIGSRRLLGFGSKLLSLVQSVRLGWLVPKRYRRLTTGLRSLRGRGRPTIGHSSLSRDAETVALLVGCVSDQWFRETNIAAIELLEMAGYRVEAPSSQTCCGALAAHDGRASAATSFAVTNATAFDGFDHVVATAAGCSAHLSDYANWGDGGVADRAVDITVLVATAIQEGKLPTVPPGRGRMGIQDPCHLRHAQRVTAEPRLIVRAAGYEPVEIDPAGMCCGAAGLYTLLHPETSWELGNQKADQIRSSGVSQVASANPGCEIQMRSAVGDDVAIAHPIEWYLRALRDHEPGLVSSAVERRND